MPKPRKTYGQLTTRTRWANPMDERDALTLSRCMGIARDAMPPGRDPTGAHVAAAVAAAFAACMARVRHTHAVSITGAPDGAGGVHLDAVVIFAGDPAGTTAFTTRPPT